MHSGKANLEMLFNKDFASNKYKFNTCISKKITMKKMTKNSKNIFKKSLKIFENILNFLKKSQKKFGKNALGKGNFRNVF